MLQACKPSELCKQEKSALSWRTVLSIHPAAELLPRTSPEELRALGEDIKKNGQRQPIAIIEKPRRQPDGTLDVGDPPLQEVLDGISRLDAMEGAGIRVIGKDGQLDSQIQRIVVDTDEVDPFTYVLSANIHRRHLTAEQKREVIAELLKAQPEKSDRQIAETVKASPTTVGTVRAKMEASGDVSKLDTRTDAKGRQQPARKAAKKTQKKKSAEKKPEKNEPVEPAAAGARDDIGADSTGEIGRLRVRNEELENKCRLLELKIAGLESENEKFKTENVALRTKLEAAQAAAASSKTAQRKPKTMGAANPCEGVALGGAAADAYRELADLGAECSDAADRTPENFQQKIDTLNDAATVLEDLSAPAIPPELAEIRINLPKPGRLHSRRERRDVAVGILSACIEKLRPIDTKAAHDLCDKLEHAVSEAEACEFPG